MWPSLAIIFERISYDFKCSQREFCFIMGFMKLEFGCGIDRWLANIRIMQLKKIHRQQLKALSFRSKIRNWCNLIWLLKLKSSEITF